MNKVELVGRLTKDVTSNMSNGGSSIALEEFRQALMTTKTDRKSIQQTLLLKRLNL